MKKKLGESAVKREAALKGQRDQIQRKIEEQEQKTLEIKLAKEKHLEESRKRAEEK